MIETNVYSAYHLTRVLLPKMMAAKAGYIFNICSIASLKAYDNGGSYSISLVGYSAHAPAGQSAAREYRNQRAQAPYPP